MILYAHMTIMICFCSCIFFNLQTRSEEWSTSRSTPDSQTISRSRLGADQQSPFLLSLLSLASQDPSTAARGPSQEWLIWLKWAGEKFEALKVLADTKSQWPLRKATGPSELMGIWGAKTHDLCVVLVEVVLFPPYTIQTNMVEFWFCCKPRRLECYISFILGMKVYLQLVILVLGNHCPGELTIQLVSCAHWKKMALSNDPAWKCKDFFPSTSKPVCFLHWRFQISQRNERSCL